MDIQEAVKIQADCEEGTVDECQKCPIGKKLCISGEGEGFDSVFTVCSLLNLLDSALNREEDYRYKPDYS